LPRSPARDVHAEIRKDLRHHGKMWARKLRRDERRIPGSLFIPGRERLLLLTANPLEIRKYMGLNSKFMGRKYTLILDNGEKYLVFPDRMQVHCVTKTPTMINYRVFDEKKLPPDPQAIRQPICDVMWMDPLNYRRCKATDGRDLPKGGFENFNPKPNLD